jgi:Carboxypeptidase regulatory-like domain
VKRLVPSVFLTVTILTFCSLTTGQQKIGSPKRLDPDIPEPAATPLPRTAATGAISGHVTDMSGNPLQGVTVYAYQGSTNVAYSTTDGNGDYVLSGLPDSSYSVWFSQIAGYIWEFFNDRHSKASADAVFIEGGGTKSNIDAQLAVMPPNPYEPNDDQASAIALTPGTYENLVIDSVGGTDEFDWFKVYVAEGQDLRIATLPILSLSGTNDDIDLVLASESGQPQAVSVSDRGNEALYVADAAAGWYDFYVFVGRELYSLTVETGDLNVGVITGRVANSLGTGVQGLWSYLHPANSESYNDIPLALFTDAAGDFRMASPPGIYKIEFAVDARVEASDIYVIPEWYSHASTFQDAAVVAIRAGQATSLGDIELADGGAISGQVTNSLGNPVLFAWARAYSSVGRQLSYSPSDAGGNYTVGHIPVGEGTCRVVFSGGGGTPEWYDNQVSFGTADQVPISQRQTTSGRNVQFAAGGTVTGQVTDGSAGLPGVTVTAYDTIQSTVPLSTSATTDANGNYTLSRLPAMTARILFTPPRSSLYRAEFYNDKDIFAEATGVTVTAGQTTPGINASLSLKSFLVTSPNGGERWATGSFHNITWTSPVPSGHGVWVGYSTDSGASWTPIAPDTPDDGTLAWQVPEILSSNCLVKVTDSVSPYPGDMSDALFMLIAGAANDLVGTWDGQGVFYRNSANGFWAKLASPADLIVAGDLDGDYQDDLVGIWPGQGGVWVLYSSTGGWAKLSSTATHIAAGDMNGDGRTDLLGTWDGQGVYYRNSVTGAWVKMASPATLITAGDLDIDGKDDLIGIWPTQGGVWVKYSRTGAWAKLASTARDIAAGDMSGDGRDDLLATWDGQGVYYRDSANGAWVKMASPADQVTCGDLDGLDGKCDLVGIWPGQGGVWMKSSFNGAWSKVSSTAKDIATGAMRGISGGANLAGTPALSEPLGGFAAGPEGQAAFKDLSAEGPGGGKAAVLEETNLIPQERGLKRASPGPGERGFIWVDQDNLVPFEQERPAPGKKERSGEKGAQKKR